MPFDDMSGTSGFTSDSEGANANLDITMSDESARNLWDVQAAIQQIATDFQTAVRAASDFNSYLISIRETGQTVKMPSLGMEGGEGGNMSYSGGRVDTGSVPGGGIQSEIGMASRIGEMEENSSGAGGGALAASRATNARPVDAGGFINSVTQAAWLTSATGQHGPSQVTQDAYQQAYQMAQGNPLDPQVLASGPGGQNGTPHSFAASQIVSQGLPAAQQFLRGGGVGGIAGMLGRLGTYGAIGYAGYQLVSAGLETYAQSRAMGISTLNSDRGAGWGFQQRIGQAGMALSPFVSQEEAAQIYSSAVDQGWASRKGGFAQGDFSSAVNFMYGAAKDYNISPEMSAQLLQTNSLGAGQSVQALSEQLLTLKQTLDGTGVSMDAATSTFTSFTGQLIAAGATGPMAAQIAGGALSAYSSNDYLRNGRGAEIVSGTLGTQQTQNVLAGLTGTVPGAALAGEGHLQASTAELDRLTRRFTDQVMNMSGLDEAEKAAMFAQLYNGTFGTNIGTQDALNMMAVNASNPAALSEGQKAYLDKGKIGKLEHQNSLQSWWHGLDDVHGWARSQTGGAVSLEDQEKNSSQINAYNYYNPEVNNLLENSGDNLQNVVLYGPDGKPVLVDGNRVAGANIAKWFNDQGNYGKFADAKSGYYIQDQSGNKYNSQNIGLGGNTDTSQAGSNDKNTIYIQLSDQAKQLIAVDRTSIPIDNGKS